MKFVIDTHTHTLASGHAYSTIQEMAFEANRKGLELIALTEHGPSMEGAPNRIYFSNMTVLPEVISNVRVLRGVELNIVDYDGNIDLPDWCLQRLDFVMAGFHDLVLSPCNDIAANTSAMIQAIANPLVDAISHPGNPVFQIDIAEVVKAAKQYGKLLEINNNSINVREGSEKNCRDIAAMCKEMETPVICGSDTHVSFGVGCFDNVTRILESVNFPEELVLNTSTEKFLDHLNTGKKGRPMIKPR